GLLLGPIFVPAGGANLERFTWMGAHPNAAGLVLASAGVVAITAPTSVLRLRPAVRAGAVVVVVAALYANHSRMSWLELAAGALLTVGRAGQLRAVLCWTRLCVVAMTTLSALLL